MLQADMYCTYILYILYISDESGPAAMQHGNGGQHHVWITKVLMLFSGLVIVATN